MVTNICAPALSDHLRIIYYIILYSIVIIRTTSVPTMTNLHNIRLDQCRLCKIFAIPNINNNRYIMCITHHIILDLRGGGVDSIFQTYFQIVMH